MLKATEQMSNSHCDIPTLPEEPLLPYYLPRDQTEILPSSTSESLENFLFIGLIIYNMYAHIYAYL